MDIPDSPAPTAPEKFALSEDETLAQRALNTLEALAVERARAANDEIKQTAALTQILRARLIASIADRFGVQPDVLADYDVTEAGYCVRRDGDPLGHKQAIRDALEPPAVTGEPTVSTPAPESAVP